MKIGQAVSEIFSKNPGEGGILNRVKLFLEEKKTSASLRNFGKPKVNFCACFCQKICPDYLDLAQNRAPEYRYYSKIRPNEVARPR